MGMGAAPSAAYCISWENLKTLCPNECSKLESVLDQYGKTLVDLALLVNEYTDADEEELTQDAFAELIACWDAIAGRFKQVTKVGDRTLEVGIGSYDREDGDRYDELDEGYFIEVENAVELTPPAKRIEQMIEFKMWTVFG